MLEIVSHKYLKKLVKSQDLNWEHIYSFGRILSKCLQTKDNYLINSEIFSTSEWYPALLVSLFLYEQDSIFILSRNQFELLVKNNLPFLKELGFSFQLNNDKIIFPSHEIRVLTLDKLIHEYCDLEFLNQRIIFTESQNIKENLKEFFKISLLREDWFGKSDLAAIRTDQLIKIYNNLKQKFFSRAIPDKNYIYLEENEIKFLKNFFSTNSFFSEKFSKVNIALSSDWACWVSLDYENFEWILNLEPIDELIEIIDLFRRNHFIFLSCSRNDHFLMKYFKAHSVEVDLSLNFKSNYLEKNILIYVPSRQILPNNPIFPSLILKKCKKLIFLRKGLNVVLTNDNHLKRDLATRLASYYGQKVLLESLPEHDENIICASFSWWIKNMNLISYPQQIIVPLLPIPSISKPINAITVSHIKRQSRDWFREFLLVEAFQFLDRSVAPLRRNSGKLVILDGRINNRKWGRELLQMIKPSKVIHYKFPFE